MRFLKQDIALNNHMPLEFQDVEQTIQQVLHAEHSIQDCEAEARMIVHKAQGRAQRINARTDERITNMEMRHGHKLDRVIKDIVEVPRSQPERTLIKIYQTKEQRDEGKVSAGNKAGG